MDITTKYISETGEHEIGCPYCGHRFPVMLRFGTQLIRCEDNFDGCSKDFAIKLGEKSRDTPLYINLRRLNNGR